MDFSQWSRAFTYRFVPPRDCAPQGEVFLIICACRSLVTVFSEALEMDSYASICSHLCLLQSGNARNGLRINTRAYSTSWPGKLHTVGQLLHRTQGLVGAPSQPLLLLPTTLACVMHQALYPGTVSVQEGGFFCLKKHLVPIHLMVPHRQEQSPVQGHYESDPSDLLLQLCIHVFLPYADHFI